MASLKELYVGKDISDVLKPAVVLDQAIVRRNCETMLEIIKALNVGFRAHVKTHKTPQIAEMQVGNEGDANFIASTIPEIEMLVPVLQKLQQNGRKCNVLYGIPLPPSQVSRLAALACQLGEKSISVMIDHPDQVDSLEQFHAESGYPACVFLKVDSGYHRAGLPPAGLNKNGLLEKVMSFERSGFAVLLGVYSHSSLSYAGTTPEDAMGHLVAEITSCKEAIEYHESVLPERQLVVSVGATPQVVSVQNLLEDGIPSPERDTLKHLLQDPSVKIELHAGVYTLLDMQQLSTNARSSTSFEEEIAISVIAEVCSIYNNDERSKPEALVAAGTLALGREPCPSYPGWGVVGSWRREQGGDRLIVERISQEHGILAWEDQASSKIPLTIGQSVRIYPNHACVTGAMYEFYLIVDSSHSDSSEIVDVWPRTRGW